MNPELTLRNLRIALVEKYSDEDSIRRVVFDIRLNTSLVAFRGVLADTWGAVLEAVEKQGKFEELLTVALEEYPDLKKVVDAYRAGHDLTVPPERSPMNSSPEPIRRGVQMQQETLEVMDTALTILHVSDMQFGKNHRFEPGELLQRTLDDLKGLHTSHHLKPDLLIVTGDLAEWGMKAEFDRSLEFINGLLEHLELGADRVVIIPGNHDINRSHCSAYFEECKGDGQNPLKPYWPKWKSFAKAFGTLYQDQAQFTFSESEPWTFFEFAPLKVVVAGLNSTIAESHLETDHYGACGEEQYRWFAQRLEAYKNNGWLRIAAVHHNTHRGAVEDDENLRDVEELRVRLLDQMNLMLHGHTHNGRWETLQNVPVLATGSAALKQEARAPHEIPNQYQIIRVHRDGFIRYCRAYDPARKKWIGDNRASRDGNTWIDEQRHAFNRVEGTFGETSTRAREKQPNEPGGPDGERTNPDDLLARLQRLKALRMPEATNLEITEHQDQALRYLRVTFKRSSATPMHLVGGCEGEWHPEIWQRFLDLRRRGDVEQAEFVVGQGTIPEEAWKQATANRVELITFVEYQGLIDFKLYLERQVQRLERDERYRSDWYVNQRLEQRNALGWRPVRDPRNTSSEPWKALEAIEHWMEQPGGALVLVLAEFGSGKSFLLRQLARRLHETNITPVFVDLSQLEKGLGFDELIGQHLIREGMLRPDLPKFHDMLEQGRIALLFDGFDELVTRTTYARATVYLDLIIAAAQGKARVVLTSRTEHFTNDQQVLQAFGERINNQVTSNKFVRINRFSDEDILEYLVKRLGDPVLAQRRFDLIREVKDLLGLSHNPRMLGFIADLNENELELARDGNGEITEASLYHTIVDRWLQHEVQRREAPGAAPPVPKADLWKIVRHLAGLIWAQANQQIGLDQLHDEIRARITEFTALDLTAETMAFQAGSGSLLVRNEEGQFSFVHRSILEYLVADLIYMELQNNTYPRTLETGKVSELMARFVVTLAGSERVNAWASAFANTTDTTASNALELRKRLEVTGWSPHMQAVLEVAPVQDYSDTNLSGKDFSGQNLRGANFSRSNLREARFVGSNLTDAVFDEADLRRADLSRANLLGTGWTGADLSLARLVGTDFTTGNLVQTKRTMGAALEVQPNLISNEWFPDLGHVHCVSWVQEDLLAVGTAAGIIWVVDAVHFTVLRPLEGHTGSVKSVAFSPDGQRIISGGDDSTVRVWNAQTGMQERLLEEHRGSVQSVAFSPDGQHIISSGSDKTVRMWNAQTGMQERTLEGHSSWVLSVAFSPDGQHIVSGGSDQTVRMWNAQTGQQERLLEDYSSSVKSVAFSPDGQRIVSGDDDSIVRMWNAQTGIGMQELTLEGHTGSVKSVAFSPDGQHIVSGGSDKTVRVWNAQTGMSERSLEGHSGSVQSVAFSPDGQRIISGDEETVRMWNAQTGQQERLLEGHSSWMLSVAFSPDGQHIISSGSDKTVRMWNAQTGIQERTLEGHTGSVRSVAFSPDGQHIVSGGSDKTVRVWNAQTGMQERLLGEHRGSVSSVAFSPDGQHIISSGSDKTVRMWNTQTGMQERTLEGHSSWMLSVAFSPDGQHIVSGDEETVRMWNAQTGQQERLLEGHSSSVQSVAFSPDGQHIVSSGGGRTVSRGGDYTVRVWDAQTGRQDRLLVGHSGIVRSVAFSSDGQHIATGDDTTVRVWNVRESTWLYAILQLPNQAWAVITPDNHFKLSENFNDGFWHVINLCRFEPGELDQYLPDDQKLHLPDEYNFLDNTH